MAPTRSARIPKLSAFARIRRIARAASAWAAARRFGQRYFSRNAEKPIWLSIMQISRPSWFHARIPYPPVDDADAESYRPDFTALIYPAYLVEDDLKIAPEFRIDSSVPPTFLVQAEDDCVRPENAVAWFLALKRSKVPAELHIWPEGGHGYGILRTGNPIEEWPVPACAWFRRQAGIL